MSLRRFLLPLNILKKQHWNLRGQPAALYAMNQEAWCAKHAGNPCFFVTRGLPAPTAALLLAKTSAVSVIPTRALSGGSKTHPLFTVQAMLFLPKRAALLSDATKMLVSSAYLLL